ncbi:cilia- and flagella-associated protein 20-like [Onthophagus taurus]|uniref:cilia- and flagella-associated protein 20-like n=1 Tax=Onthophagus taurus TaxID=166361 RepID=UPI0039BEC411
MFANAFQSGFITVFYSIGSSPLNIWDKQVKNGHIRRVVDDEVKSLVLEISGTNVATTYITCPIKPRASLAIRLPFLVMIVKNMKKYFSFEIQILDDKDMHRRFRVSNFQSTTKVRPFCTTMPIGLSCGWNQIQFNLADFTRRAYGTLYLETMRIQVHANVRIRRIYFADRLYSEDEMPSEYRLFVPVGSKKDAKDKATEKASEAAKDKPADAPAEPTAAPPSPAEPASEEVQVQAQDLSEKPETATTEPPTTDGEGAAAPEPSEAAPEAAPAEGEAPAEAPAEGEAPAEAPAEGEAPAEAPPEGEAPAEAPAEGEAAA